MARGVPPGMINVGKAKFKEEEERGKCEPGRKGGYAGNRLMLGLDLFQSHYPTPPRIHSNELCRWSRNSHHSLLLERKSQSYFRHVFWSILLNPRRPGLFCNRVSFIHLGFEI
nr:uncharacterized protein LOC132767146 isoform X2 [Anolis sagrei ordinatus]